MYSKLFLSAILLAAPLITEGKYAADSSDDSKVIISTDKSSWTIRGKVIDAQTGEEIIGAAVMVKDDPEKWAVSGLDGSFSVSVDAEKAEELDPMFAAYNLDVDPSKLLWNKTEVSDFYLQSGSPALSGACPASQYTPYFASDGIRIEGTGKTYTSPAVTAQFGALGTK